MITCFNKGGIDLNGKEFNKDYNVSSFYGNFSGTIDKPHPLLSSFIYGMDFRFDAPKTNRNILRDKGSNQKFVFDGFPDQLHKQALVNQRQCCERC